MPPESNGSSNTDNRPGEPMSDDDRIEEWRRAEREYRQANPTKPDGIVNCIEESYRRASDFPSAATTPDADDARREALAMQWVALEGLVALTRTDPAAAFAVLDRVKDVGALHMFTMQAATELAALAWEPPWPDAVYEDAEGDNS